jgi:integrase
MKLSAYLGHSRHGIYYFRWPLPVGDNQKRQTIKLSLRTRCPDHAGDLARHLASYGRLLKEDKDLAKLTRTELRIKVKEHFAAQLAQYLHCLERKEPSKKLIADAHEELLDHKSFLEIESTHPQWLKIPLFKSHVGISDQDWADSQPMATNELRKGRIDLLRAILSAVEHPSTAPTGQTSQMTIPRPDAPSAPLGDVVAEFMAEHNKWSDDMRNKTLGYLSVLQEFFGTSRPIGSIKLHDARALKKVFQSYPANRNTRPETRGLSLADALKIEGTEKISVATANLYIDTYRRLWDWAHRHGYVEKPLFVRMKFDLDKNADNPRDAFTQEETKRLFKELTENTTGIVKKPDYKWATLIALYTGARRREIAQLFYADIDKENEIWYFDFNDNHDKKSLKSKAARRRVPIHPKLIELGFLEYVQSRHDCERLFPAFSYSPKEGYGRNLGRFFNESLLPKLGMKRKELVFHSLRHTLVDRLTDAGIEEPVIQFVIGHSRDGTTQNSYNKKGYALERCLEVLEKFEV